jgi:hypothetical protein
MVGTARWSRRFVSLKASLNRTCWKRRVNGHRRKAHSRCRSKPRRSAISSRCVPRIKAVKRTLAPLPQAPCAHSIHCVRDRPRPISHAPLSERQRALLVEWGYPYVFDEFRFHMTLSSSLADAGERATLVAWWQAQTPALGPLAIDHAALFVEPAPGEPFVLWQRVPFQIDEVK